MMDYFVTQHISLTAVLTNVSHHCLTVAFKKSENPIHSNICDVTFKTITTDLSVYTGWPNKK